MMMMMMMMILWRGQRRIVVLLTSVQRLVIHRLSTRVAEGHCDGCSEKVKRWPRWITKLLDILVESYKTVSGGTDNTAFQRHESDAGAQICLTPTSIDRDGIAEGSFRYFQVMSAAFDMVDQNSTTYCSSVLKCRLLWAAFLYSSQLQTWSKTWSHTREPVESRSKAGRKPAVNLLQTWWFLLSSHVRDMT